MKRTKKLKRLRLTWKAMNVGRPWCGDAIDPKTKRNYIFDFLRLGKEFDFKETIFCFVFRELKKCCSNGLLEMLMPMNRKTTVWQDWASFERYWHNIFLQKVQMGNRRFWAILKNVTLERKVCGKIRLLFSQTSGHSAAAIFPLYTFVHICCKHSDWLKIFE